MNKLGANESSDFNDLIFGIDIQALYSSVKFQYLRVAMMECIDKCTDWSVQGKSLLLDLIIYTPEYQQILWDNKFYILDKGIPTGDNHCDPCVSIYSSVTSCESYQIQTLNLELHSILN